jgi:glycosyltransferase involved in cell wall biosynthesis
VELFRHREEATVHRDQTMDDVRPYDLGEGLAAMRREEIPFETFGASQALPAVSVVIAALNEEQNLEHVLPRIPETVDEIILVDGCSTDGTVETAKRVCPRVRVIQQCGRGKGDALRCGFDAAQGDIIVALDADGSTDPAEIPSFVAALHAGADYAKGSRFVPGAGTADMTMVRVVGNRALLMLVRALFAARYTDLCYGYFAFWKRCLPALALKSDGFEIETEVNVRAAIAKLKVVEVASYEHERIAGEAHLQPLRDGWRVLKEIVRQKRDSARGRSEGYGRLRRDLVED